MTAPVVGRVVLSDPAMLHGGVGPIMLELHDDGSTTWRPIYQSQKGRKFAPKDEAEIAAHCCCRYGAAVSGEYPEFGCPECPKHQGALGETAEDRCGRHVRAASQKARIKP